MKHRKPRGAISHERKKGLPEEIKKELNKAGLETADLIYSCELDMNNEALYKDCRILFDSKGLYVATGTKSTEKKKRKAPPEFTYTLEELRSYPIEETENIETERYTSTGRIIARISDEDESLTRFSISHIADAENFARAFNSYKKTGKAEFSEEEKDDEGKCRKCGAPCPPGKEFCRKHSKKSSTAIRLMKFFKGYTFQIILIILFMLLGSAVGVIIPQLSTRALYDDVLANPDGNPVSEVLKALGVLVLSVFGIRLLGTILTVVQEYASASITPRVMFSIKTKIFSAMQRLSVNFYSSKQTGSLMDTVMRDANNIYWFFTDGIPRMVIDGATLIGILIAMFSMSPLLSVIALGSTPFLALTLIFGGKAFRRLHHSVWVKNAKVDSTLSDNINGQRVIKAFSKEDDEYQRFSDVSESVRKAELKLALSEATLIPILETVALLLSIIVLYAGGRMVINGTDGMTAGTLLSFIVYIEMLKGPFGFLTWVSNWWSRCADSAQRIFEICDAEPEITENENAVAMENVEGNVVIEDLEFEYEPARPVIKNLSLKVDAHNMLGIVGKTGAGKSTIANLIARLYDAKKGCIKIDGVDVRDMRLQDLRKNIGLVSQDIYLFMGSIADNIRYANPGATMEQVITAAKAACAHDFIMKLPDAYETRVGAGGQKLSGGEKQRISIARTIIQNPAILILDEATAAMDTETERNIQHSLSMLTEGRTTISIAHRLSTLRDSDYLAVIDNGEIVEYGTYVELLKMKGEFYKQYKIQSEALKTIGIGETETIPEEKSDEEEQK